MGDIIDGKALATRHSEELKQKIEKLGVQPRVVSYLIGEDEASLKYSSMKQKKAVEVGIDFEIKKFSSDTSFDLVAKEIERLNADQSVTGIMIQMPLPKQFLSVHPPGELIGHINPKKDVDGLTGMGPVLPATVRGILSILNDLALQAFSLQGKRFAVVGSEGMVGKALVKVLTEKGVKVVKVDKRDSPTTLEDIKDADVVISCSGVNNLIKPEMIKDGAVLIDVGLGDFDPECYKKAAIYTPPIGGVGPMTVISLMENVVELLQLKEG